MPMAPVRWCSNWLSGAISRATQPESLPSDRRALRHGARMVPCLAGCALLAGLHRFRRSSLPSARAGHRRVEGHLDHHVREPLRHERQYVRVVVAEVVAPPERVVDAASVGTRNVSFEAAEVSGRTGQRRSAACSSPARSVPRSRGTPARLNCSASVPTGENSMWLSPIELK